MKKIFCLLFCILLPFAALADPFLDDFNAYSDMYHISPISALFTGSPQTYSSDTIEIMNDGTTVTLISQNDLDLISAACYVLRVIDNAGSMIDQYGRILHAYFMAAHGDGEKRATTDSGVLVFVSKDAGYTTIKLVK